MAAYLGEFEQLVLLAVLRLGTEAHGPEIARALETRAGRTVSRGHLYTTLDLLQDNGLIRCKLAPGGAVRDGPQRRLYNVSAAGIGALRESRDVLRRMWRGLEDALGER